ncbi:MAG: transporter substrate-binding domain-containing protein [Desulforegulaceae bacterium]|nr:transporter substrate-binding domain-containing protein [Desulforegulaceae bacterium]
MKLKLLIILCLLIIPKPVLSIETISLSSLEWAPYIGKSLENEGYIAELVKKAFEISGYKAHIEYMPWARTVEMTKNGEFDGYLPEYYADTLNENFLVSKPFPGGPLVLFKLKSKNISYSKLEDLKLYNIGVVRGYVNTQEFDNASYLKKDEAKDDLTNLKKLGAGRIDLMIADKFVGLYLIKQKLPHYIEKIVPMEPVLEQKDLFLCISKKTKNPEIKLKAFNEGLDKMKEKKLLEEILKKHGF